jgi:hypothetical protein
LSTTITLPSGPLALARELFEFCVDGHENEYFGPKVCEVVLNREICVVSVAAEPKYEVPRTSILPLVTLASIGQIYSAGAWTSLNTPMPGWKS